MGPKCKPILRRKTRSPEPDRRFWRASTPKTNLSAQNHNGGSRKSAKFASPAESAKAALSTSSEVILSQLPVPEFRPRVRPRVRSSSPSSTSNRANPIHSFCEPISAGILGNGSPSRSTRPATACGATPTHLPARRPPESRPSSAPCRAATGGLRPEMRSAKRNKSRLSCFSLFGVAVGG